MSFIIYNEPAFYYEKETSLLIEKDFSLDDNNLSPQDYQALKYRSWKQRQSLKPSDYDFLALPQSTVNLLLAEISNFSFPSDGLEGVEKTKMIEDISDFRGELSHSCWELKNRLTKLIQFLDRHPKIFHF